MRVLTTHPYVLFTTVCTVEWNIPHKTNMQSVLSQEHDSSDWGHGEDRCVQCTRAPLVFPNAFEPNVVRLKWKASNAFQNPLSSARISITVQSFDVHSPHGGGTVAVKFRLQTVGLHFKLQVISRNENIDTRLYKINHTLNLSVSLPLSQHSLSAGCWLSCNSNFNFRKNSLHGTLVKKLTLARYPVFVLKLCEGTGLGYHNLHLEGIRGPQMSPTMLIWLKWARSTFEPNAVEKLRRAA